MEAVGNTIEHDRLVVEAQLVQHWALDSVAAAEVASGISDEGCRYIDTVLGGIEQQGDAIQARDHYREEIAQIFCGNSDKQLIVIGPCSLDDETDYGELFDYIEELQELHPEALIALRANGSKPRSKGGWGGLVRSTDPEQQETTVSIYQQAFLRHIPILTEITDKDEYSALAPYLSAAWLGARDMQSTSLHNLAMASRLPFAVKNGTDGQTKTVENALIAIGKNSQENEGSGVNLGLLAATYQPNGVGLPAMVEVGEGNKNVAIIARGYELPDDMPAQDRYVATLRHLGELCKLAAERECAVILDGGHSVPEMIEIPRKDGDRFPRVMQVLSQAILAGEVERADRIRGKLIEIGPKEGRTDVNWLISAASSHGGLSAIIRRGMAELLAVSA